MINKKVLILFICCLITSSGIAFASGNAITELWTQNTKEEYSWQNMATDGQYLYIPAGNEIHTIDKKGNSIYKKEMSEHISGIEATSKHLVVAEGKRLNLLNKTSGKTIWAIDITEDGYCGYMLKTKSGYIVINVASDAGDIIKIVNETSGAIIQSINAEEGCLNAEPQIIGGILYLKHGNNVLKAYKLINKPDLTVKKVTKIATGLNIDIVNSGYANSDKALLKLVVQKVDGSYKTIHIQGKTINANGQKTIQVNGAFKKGYVVIDPYYEVSELNEKNNQIYFS